MKLENRLRELLSKRALTEEPRVGRYSWVVFVKGNSESQSTNMYKMIHTGRLQTQLKNIGRDKKFAAEEPIVIKVWDGADYFAKVMRRIFKSKKVTPTIGGKDWFQLDARDIKWLRSIPVCKSFGLDSEACTLLGANTLHEVRKEGLL